MGLLNQYCKVLLLLLSTPALPLPRFEAYWESAVSWTDDEGGWNIRLGSIAVGPLGNHNGPSVVTIDAADYCVSQCQESYPDEFCSKYPPEGVPNVPRAVEDWGTKYNITSTRITEGVRAIHERGGKVVLAYGGTLHRTGITAEGGGGDPAPWVDEHLAEQLATRIYHNILDWDLDGVDFLAAGVIDPVFGGSGNSAAYHMEVIRRLRKMVGQTKTISYSTTRQPFVIHGNANERAIIAACHPYLDFITLGSYYGHLVDTEAIAEIEFLGIPFHKLGRMLFINGVFGDIFDNDYERMIETVAQVKELGMGSVSLFTINKENGKFNGQFAEWVAQFLYG